MWPQRQPRRAARTPRAHLGGDQRFKPLLVAKVRGVTPTWYTNWAFSARNRPQFWPLCVVQKVGSQPVHLNPVIATLHVTRFALHPDVPQHPSKAQGRPWSLTWCLLWRPPPLVGVSQSATKRIPERKERKRGQSHDPGAPHPLQPPLRAGHSAHGAPDSRNRPL